MGNWKSSFDYTIHHFPGKKEFSKYFYFQGKIRDGISKFNFTDFITFSHFKYLFLLRKFVKILEYNYPLFRVFISLIMKTLKFYYQKYTSKNYSFFNIFFFESFYRKDNFRVEYFITSSISLS